MTVRYVKVKKMVDETLAEIEQLYRTDVVAFEQDLKSAGVNTGVTGTTGF